VAYRVAVAAVVGGSFSLAAGLRFVVGAVAGVLRRAGIDDRDSLWAEGGGGAAGLDTR